MSDSVDSHIWTVDVPRGQGMPPISCVVIRLKPPTGARMMLLTQVISLLFFHDGTPLMTLFFIQVIALLGRSDSTIRDAASAAGVELYRHEANETIRRLVTMQVIMTTGISTI